MMITEKIYDINPLITSFEATVLECSQKEDLYYITLDRTAFFPEQGGQYGDMGTLQNLPVLDVQIRDHIIYHVMNQFLEPGSNVSGCVDWNNRFDYMQQHSGEHIISGLIHRYFHLDNVGFHLGQEEVTLDFNGILTKEQLATIEKEANTAIYENFDVSVSFPSKEQLNSMRYRSKIELEGAIRIVEFPGYDTCACCAPHVAKTGEIGLIKITNSQNYKGGMRINILCGYRAFTDYIQKSECISTLSAKLSAKPSALTDAVTRLEQELLTQKERFIALQQQLIQTKIEALSQDTHNACLFEPDLDTITMRKAINQLTQHYGGYSCLFVGDDERGYRYIIGSSKCDCQVPSQLLHDLFSAKGGGSKAMVQGQLTATKEDILKCLKF